MSVQGIAKSAFAAMALLGVTAAISPAANAGHNVDIHLGLGGGPGGHGSGYGYSEPGDDYDIDPGYRHPRPYRISCWQGRESVKWAGFRMVQPVDCDGRRYSYKARKRGDWFLVSVSSRSGNIVSVRDLY